MKRLDYALLLVVPAILVLLSIVLGHARGPFSLAENNDPEYCYVFNSLSVLTLHVPQHTDHPGTTLQEIGAAVMLADWLPGDRTPLARSVLSHPEKYLRAINLVLAILVAASVFWAGTVLYQAAKSIFPAIVLQLSTLLFADVIASLARVSPEPLLVATGFAMIAILIPVLLGEEIRNAWIAGVIFGFGFVTKITFAPWIVVVFLFRHRKHQIQFLIAAAVSAIVFLIPIFPQLPRVASWIQSLAIHTERYGGGPVGMPATSQWMLHAADLYHFQPFVFILPLFYLISLVVLLFRKSDDPVLRATKNALIIGCLIVTMQLAMTLKHYAAHYMVAGLVSVALMNGFLAWLLLTPILPGGLRIGLSVAGALLFFGAVRDTKGIVLFRLDKGYLDQASTNELARKRSEMPDCVTIGYYRSSFPGFALSFGDEYSGGVHGPLLKEIYSDQIMFNRFGGGFRSYTMEPRLAEVSAMLAQGRCVLMQGSASTDWPLNLPKQIMSSPIAVIRGEGLYRLALVPGSE